jgi:hypothetical protein
VVGNPIPIDLDTGGTVWLARYTGPAGSAARIQIDSGSADPSIPLQLTLDDALSLAAALVVCVLRWRRHSTE